MVNHVIIPRSDADRRSGFDRRDLSDRDARLLKMCTHAGAIFKGVQSGFGVSPDLILFQREVIGTTLCLEVTEELSSVRIANRMAESEKQIAATRKAFGMKFPSTHNQQASVASATAR